MTTAGALTYCVITPVWNEERHLPTCFASLRRQRLRPVSWTIVDSGSSDATLQVARALAHRHDWIKVLALPAPAAPGRGGPIARAYHAGIDSIGTPPGLLAFVDADVSFGADYFLRLASAFDIDPTLGIASGRQLERVRGKWREQRMTGTMVAAPLRVYRWQCLQDVLPLDDDLGWDGLDHVRASLGGWRTAVLQATTFHHHRREGQREGRWRYWAGEGQASYRMGYRPSYLLARMAYRAAFEPAALMLVYGYASSMLRRESLLASTDVRRSIRDAQRLRELPNRIREAIGHPQRAL